MMRLMLRNYTRIAYIDTGAYEQEHYRAVARENAERFDLRFEEIQGSPNLVEKLLYGPWDEECVVVERGRDDPLRAVHEGSDRPPPQMPGFGRG